MYNAKLFLNCQIASPILRACDIAFNSKLIIKLAEQAIKAKRALLILPELALTGGFLNDLHQSGNVLDQVQHYLQDILLASANWPSNFALVFGSPLVTPEGQHNAALVISQGKIIQTACKQNLTNVERQQFLKAQPKQVTDDIFLLPVFGPYKPVRVQLVVGDDIYLLNESAADLIVHISNEPFTSRQAAKLKLHLQNLAQVANLAILHVNSSIMSPSDLYYHQAEYQAYEGNLCLLNKHLQTADYLQFAKMQNLDISAKLEQIEQACKLSYQKSVTCSLLIPRLTNWRIRRRLKIATEAELVAISAYFDLRPAEKRLFNPAPYLYQSPSTLANCGCQGLAPYTDCLDKVEYYSNFWQAASESLLKRLYTAHAKKFILGLSGGLDSCVALLTCYLACKLGNLPLATIQPICMPGFGSSQQSQNQANDLLKALHIEAETINIKQACLQHFADIKQAIDNYDVTYENAQARERTQILMDKANQLNGIVVGTGDLSEECLGFSTYNGDQMSMFNPNAGIPKSLMPSLLAIFPACYEKLACEPSFDPKELTQALKLIYEANISPELLPLTKTGEQKQVTQKVVGSYLLHDFFFYHLADANYCIEELLELACDSFSADNIQALSEINFDFGPKANVYAKQSFNRQEIKQTLEVFTKRYVQQQYKQLPAPASVNFTDYNLTNALHIPSDLAINPFIHEKY